MSRTASKWGAKRFCDAKKPIRDFWDSLETGVELTTFLTDSTHVRDIERDIDPSTKNISTGICLSGNTESFIDCLKRPTLEDVYNIQCFSKIANMTIGNGVVWLPDSTYMSNDFHWRNVKDPEVIKEVVSRYETFCKSTLPANSRSVKMSSVMFDDIEEQSKGILDSITRFYSLHANQLVSKPHLKRALHVYALTIAYLALGPEFKQDLDVLTVLRAEEKGTVEVARSVLSILNKPNKISMVSPIHFYGHDPDKGIVDCMFDGRNEGVLYIGSSADENMRKVNYFMEREPDLVKSWMYLIQRSSGLQFTNPRDIVEYMSNIRGELYGR